MSESPASPPPVASQPSVASPALSYGIHLFSFSCFQGFFFFLYLLLDHEFSWFLVPYYGWLIGLICHLNSLTFKSHPYGLSNFFSVLISLNMMIALLHPDQLYPTIIFMSLLLPMGLSSCSINAPSHLSSTFVSLTFGLLGFMISISLAISLSSLIPLIFVFPSIFFSGLFFFSLSKAEPGSYVLTFWAIVFSFAFFSLGFLTVLRSFDSSYDLLIFYLPLFYLLVCIPATADFSIINLFVVILNFGLLIFPIIAVEPFSHRKESLFGFLFEYVFYVPGLIIARLLINMFIKKDFIKKKKH
ncbi:hypothetical protein GEMRC1_005614 [Eukaryota sp. GEM-RC1]